MCGVKGRGTSSFRGPTSLRSAAGPPQEPPEDNAPPAQSRGAAGGILQRSSSSLANAGQSSSLSKLPKGQVCAYWCVRPVDWSSDVSLLYRRVRNSTLIGAVSD